MALHDVEPGNGPAIHYEPPAGVVFADEADVEVDEELRGIE